MKTQMKLENDAEYFCNLLKMNELPPPIGEFDVAQKHKATAQTLLKRNVNGFKERYSPKLHYVLRSFITLSLVTLFLLSMLKSNAQNGLSCDSAITTGRMNVAFATIRTADYYFGYRSLGDTAGVSVLFEQGTAPDSIVISTGNCANGTRLVALTNFISGFPQIAEFFSDSNYVMVHVYRSSSCGFCYTDSTVLSVGFYSKRQGSSGMPSGCDQFTPGCNLVCNPSFEDLVNGNNPPSSISQLYKAEHWDNMHPLRTPDLFRDITNCSAFPCMDIPLNSFGNANEQWSNEGYSGMIVFGSSPVGPGTQNYNGSYFEYLEGNLRVPMIPGLNYTFRIHVNMACVSELKANKLQVCFSQNSLCDNATNPGNNCGSPTLPVGIPGNSQVLNMPVTSTTHNQWEIISTTFTPTNPYEVLTFGLFETPQLNNQIEWINNAACQSVQSAPPADADTWRWHDGLGMWVQVNQASWAYYYIDSVTVVPTSPVTVEEKQVCIGDHTLLTVNSAITNVTWSVPGYSGNVINYAYQGPVQLQYWGTILGNCTVTGFFNLSTSPSCCHTEIAGSAGPLLYVADGAPEPFLASDLIVMNSGNNNIGPQTGPMGQTQDVIYIYGNFIVDQDLIFANHLDIRMGDDAKIFVNPGVKLTILNECVLRAGCEKMWEGIQLLGDPDHRSHLVMDNSEIQDARTAIFTDDGVGQTYHAGGGFYEITGSRFNQNHRNIVVRNWSDFPGEVVGTSFTCQTTNWSIATNGYLLEQCQNPNWPFERTFSGIEAFNVTSINIGQLTYPIPGGSITFPMSRNNFENMDVGIFTSKANTVIVNNELRNFALPAYMNPTFNQHCSCLLGTGICQANKKPDKYEFYTTVIGDAVDPDLGNTLHHLSFGISISGNYISNIQNNMLYEIYVQGQNNVNHHGIIVSDVTKVYDPVTQFHIINSNELWNVEDVYIFLDDNYCEKRILNNEMNLNTTYASIPNNCIRASGILINEPDNLRFSPQLLRCEGNDIWWVKNGIEANKVADCKIENNDIVLNTMAIEPGNYDQSNGIKTDLCLYLHIGNNLVRAQSRDNYWVNGIWVSDCRSNDIFCNTMARTGVGMRYEGFLTNEIGNEPNNTSNFIYKNRMHDNMFGYWVNNGNTGHQNMQNHSFYGQGGGEGAAHNWWSGTWGGAYYHTYFTSSTIPPATNYLPEKSMLYVPTAGGLQNPNPLNPQGNDPNYLLAPHPTYSLNSPDGAYKTAPDMNNLLSCNAITENTQNELLMPNGGQVLMALAGSGDPEAASIWWAYYNAYRILLENEDSLNSQQQAYLDSVHFSPLGQIETILSYLNDSLRFDSITLTTALSNLYSINPANAMEDNLKIVTSSYLRLLIPSAVSMSDSSWVQTEVALLEPLAWLCPQWYGPAVYQARSILRRFGESTKAYYNDCEEIHFPNSSSRISPQVEQGTENWFNDDLDESTNPISNSSDQQLIAFPNPANNDVFVTINNSEIKNVTVEIYNALGQQENVSIVKIENGWKANLSGLSNGMYLIRVTDSQGFLGKTYLIKQ